MATIKSEASQFARQKKRVPLHLPVEVTTVEMTGRRVTEETRSLNVSGGGICFESRRDHQVGGRINLLIHLPARLRRYFGGKSVYGVRAVICRVELLDPSEAASADAHVRKVGARFLAAIPS